MADDTQTERSRDGRPEPLHDTRVLIIGGYPLHGECLRDALRARKVAAQYHPVSWDEPTAWAQDVQQVVAAIPAAGHDSVLVVLDIDIDVDTRSGLGAVEQTVATLVRQGRPTALLTSNADTSAVAVGVAVGASAVLDRWCSLAQIHEVLGHVADGRPGLGAARRWLLTERARREQDRHRDELASRRRLGERLERLSARERQVLELLTAGQRAHVIAQTLTVSLPTVRAQIRGILTKLDVTSQLEAVAVLNSYRTGVPTIS